MRGVHDRSQPGPHLLPRPSQAESAWQRLILDPRRKPLPRECQARPEDTNICSASALLAQIRHPLWGWLLWQGRGKSGRVECEGEAIALGPLMNPTGSELLESNSSSKQLNNTPAPFANICSNKANLFPHISLHRTPMPALLRPTAAESVQLDCGLGVRRG